MMKNQINIHIGDKNRRVEISIPVKYSNQASQVADRLNALPYLDVFQRSYLQPFVKVIAHTIPGIFDIEQFHTDLELMSDFIKGLNEAN